MAPRGAPAAGQWRGGGIRAGPGAPRAVRCPAAAARCGVRLAWAVSGWHGQNLLGGWPAPSCCQQAAGPAVLVALEAGRAQLASGGGPGRARRRRGARFGRRSEEAGAPPAEDLRSKAGRGWLRLSDVSQACSLSLSLALAPRRQLGGSKEGPAPRARCAAGKRAARAPRRPGGGARPWGAKMMGRGPERRWARPTLRGGRGRRGAGKKKKVVRVTQAEHKGWEAGCPPPLPPPAPREFRPR